ncbi:hypothetical protein [Novosphingobium sp. SG707]|uniref:hypothetical protein n=1 Tax=Novosphingobium sp. SG707 TaxID=2586996 RepID=UPI0014452DAD|nr:hypothetical protein [Novosphingobium sp. SG707]NKI99576.1 hypothetical protein [Novosphingobium sp. SG707]
MKMIRCLAALMALALMPSPLLAQNAPAGAAAPAGYAPMSAPCAMAQDGKCYAIGPTVGLPVATPAASSTPCTVSATTSAATPTGCTATGSAGVYVVGGFAPQAGYPIRLVTTGTWAGTIAVGTSVDNCTTVNALTVAGQTWGSYTGNANEAVDVPVTTGSVKYCLSISLTSGTINAALRQ